VERSDTRQFEVYEDDGFRKGLNPSYTLGGEPHRNSTVIPGCATWRRPGIHTPCRGYGFRARASRAPE